MDHIPLDLLIGADDRTGALESAGAVAAVIGRPVTVLTERHIRADIDALAEDPASDGPTEPGPGNVGPANAGPADMGPVVTVDLGSRHLGPVEAGHRAAALDRLPSNRHVHKIDSTLRGRWAVELVARSAGGTRPVVLVPALPALGRTCVGGVVLVDGRPVAETSAAADLIAPPGASRPAELLTAAGAPDVREIGDPKELREWLAQRTGFVVADAASDDDIRALVEVCDAHPEILLAGTSAVALAVAGLIADVGGREATGPPRARPDRLLIVVGSAHGAAIEQLSRLRRHGAHQVSPDRPVTAPPGVPVVIASEAPQTGTIPVEVAERHARTLADATIRWTEALEPDLVVVIGGDTAAAVLGDDPVEVLGVVAPGTPWLRQADRTVVTRAGGFGGPDALDDLVWGTLVG